MNEVEELRKPFDESGELLAAVKSARNDANRLRIVRHRIQQSKPLLSKIALDLVADVVTLIPHYTTDDWTPSDSFVEDFLEGKIEFEGDAIVGGPNYEETAPLEPKEPKLGDEDLQASWDALMQSLEVHKVQKRVWQLIRRSWLHEGTTYPTIAKSRFWWLLVRAAEFDELYRENPLKIVSEFFGKFFSGGSVEVDSLSSPVPKGAKAELLQIAELLRSNLLDEITPKTKTLLEIALGQRDAIAICALVVDNLREEDSLSWEGFASLILSSLEDDHSSADVRLAVHAIPLFLEWLEEKDYVNRIFRNDDDDDADSESTSNYAFVDSFPTTIATLVYRYYLNEIRRTYGTNNTDLSEAALASVEFLKDKFPNILNPNSEEVLEHVRKVADKEDGGGESVLAQEFLEVIDLLKIIEFERLMQVSDIYSGVNRPPLRIDAIGYSFEREEILKLDPVDQFPAAAVFSKCLRILSEDYFHVTLDDLSSISSDLNELGLWKVSSALYCLTLEAQIGENPDESFDFLDDPSMEQISELCKIYATFPEDYRRDIDVTLARWHQSFADVERSPLLDFFPSSILNLDLSTSSESLLLRMLGSECWDQMAGETKEELILAEDLFRRLETARRNHGTQSTPAPLVHWSRVLERLLKTVASEVLREVEVSELSDRDKPIVSKIQGGHASLGELVSVLLELKKRLKGASNAVEIIERFELTNFFKQVADNVQHREGLRLIGRLRNRAPHDASLDFADVLLAKYTLFTTGLLKALIVSSS
ncbi:hypothetical protein [Ruegeria arenilitoris]|uniref:hypothetical protein n=1 Tax=Ruegeria arenilitoris TaxID=1173585 RepID=UPI001480170D|nr:hypothetical protein [Ruegeria arenilitoris]